jgi:two-component system, chemotaxis family, chemotaxis protein CheY
VKLAFVRGDGEDAMDQVSGQIKTHLAALKVLVIDDERTMRKVTRSLLQAIGVRTIHEADDGRSGLEAVCALCPDLVVLDWRMPNLNGADFVRTVRSPGKFPFPDVPIIMLTAFGEHSRVVEAIRLGVNEFLLKPVSSKALLTRIVSILSKPRRMVKRGDFYAPEPRKTSSYKPELDLGLDDLVLLD